MCYTKSILENNSQKHARHNLIYERTDPCMFTHFCSDFVKIYIKLLFSSMFSLIVLLFNYHIASCFTRWKILIYKIDFVSLSFRNLPKSIECLEIPLKGDHFKTLNSQKSIEDISQDLGCMNLKRVASIRV